jgi:acyl-CoA reductase-like NAD-dependent aldehyde dehydrogenase
MRLKAAYGQVLSRIGDPLDKKILTGPLHSAAAVKSYQDTLSEAVKAGGTIEFGGNVSCLLSLFSMYIVLRMYAY